MSLSSGLAHLWPMDETSGALVEDLVGDLGSGSVVDDALSETIVDSATGFGKARDLAAPTGGAYLDLYTGASDSGAYELMKWTLSVRFRSNAGVTTDYPALWFLGAYPNAHYVEVWMRRSTNTVGFNAADSTGTEIIAPSFTPTADIDSGEWYRVTLTNDGSAIRLYFGTELAATQAISNPVKLLLKSQKIYIGTWVDTDVYKFPPGDVDDAAIWCRALTQAEIESTEYQTASVPVVSAESASLFDPNPSASRYSYLDIDDGVADPIRIPISSWQATLQADRANFVQAVIPNVGEWITSVIARRDSGEIIIYHAVRETDGSEQEWEAARAPLQQFLTDQGPLRFTGRVVGYATASLGNPCVVRVLRNIRSVSTSAGLRVRCDYDPTLRPGETVRAGELEFMAAYVNAYCTDSDRYMDVGERVL